MSFMLWAKIRYLRNRPREIAIVSLIFAWFVFVPQAHAGGLYVGDIEAVGLGQGGAYIASPETLSAVSYNPAALAGPKGLRLELEGGFSSSPLTFKPSLSVAGASGIVQNQQPYRPAFLAGVAYDFGIRDLGVAFVAYTPGDAHEAFSDYGAQKFQLISATNTIIHFHLAAAYRLFKMFSVGMAFGGSYFSTTEKLAVSAAPFGDPEASDFTLPVNLSATQPFIVTSNFGIRVEPIKQLAIGFSFMPPFDVNANGTIQIQLPPALTGVQLNGNHIVVNLRFPLIVRLGLRYRPLPQFSAELAAVYEGWSRLKSADVVPDITLNAPVLGFSNAKLPVISQTKNYRDLYSLRLGVEAKPLSFFQIRAGAYYETSATQANHFDISAPDANKFAVTGGVSFKVWRIFIDATYAHIFPQSVLVTHSQNMLLNVVPGVTNTVAVGNGRYDFSYDLFHVGLRANFFD